MITQTATLTHRLVATALTQAGATRHQYAVLAAVEEFGAISQAQLGRRCHIDRSDIVATINDLTTDGHVERHQDPTDRRQNLITLTAEGRRRLDHIAGVLDDVQADLLDHLPAKERDALTNTLRRILDHHTTENHATESQTDQHG